jgi:nucleotide-binding universal stress UspA family protein
MLAVAVVLSNLEYEDAVPFVIAQAEKDMEQKVDTLKTMAKEAGVDCEVIVQRGDDPYLDIIKEAEKNKADMIVLGTHGRTGIKRFVMGSVTAKVIGHAPCRVLVVPAHAKVDFGTILAATDGSKHGDAAVTEAIAIAKICNSPLVILSAASSDDEAQVAEESTKQALELANKEGVSKEGMVLRGKPGEAIVEAAEQKKVGLIVMGSHGRTGLMNLLMGSVTEYVLSHGNTPVLVAKVA